MANDEHEDIVDRLAKELEERMIVQAPKANLVLIECGVSDSYLESMVDVFALKTDAYQLSNRLILKILKLIEPETWEAFYDAGNFVGRKSWTSEPKELQSEDNRGESGTYSIYIRLINNKDLEFVSEDDE